MYAINKLGEHLREERERQGLSLEDVAKKTYIRRRYLESLETGDYSVMPGEVYLKGFLRSYAEALGLNGWDLVEEYNRLCAAASEEADATGTVKEAQPIVTERARETKPSQGHLMQNPIMLPAKEKYLQNKSKQDRRLLVLGFLVIVSVAAYFFLVPNWVEAPGTGNSITETIAEPIEAIPNETPVLPEETSDSPAALSEPQESLPAGESEAIVDAPPVVAQSVIEAPVNVVIKATEDCWVEIYADGQFVYTGVIAAGNERQALGDQKVQVRLGNPKGVEIIHNGQKLGEIGKEVQTRVFTQDAHYTIQDLRKEQPPLENTVQSSPDQDELAGIIKQAEN